MSSSNCCFLTCIQISQEADQVLWYSHLLKNFPQFVVIHTVKGFGISQYNRSIFCLFVCFLKHSCFFYNPLDFGNLIYGSSVFSKYSLNIWKFMADILLKPCMENFENYFVTVWDDCNWVVLTFFAIVFRWDWNEKWLFPVLWPLLSFANLLIYWV